jgi:hypothetical protein
MHCGNQISTGRATAEQSMAGCPRRNNLGGIYDIAFLILDCPDSLYFKFERSMASTAMSNKKIHQKMYAPCTFAAKTIMAKKNLCHSSQKRPMTQNQKEKNELVF